MWAKLDSKLPEIIEKSTVKARFAVESTATAVVRRCKAHSRVRTGLMRAEWEYDIITFTEAIVFNLVRYTVYNEYGTRYMSAKPMIRPAILETRDEFAELVAEIYKID